MKLSYYILLAIVFIACEKIDVNAQSINMSSEMKKYWYNNEAEISSYSLVQARYGEIREGKAVLIYVTETFSNKTFAKALFLTSKIKDFVAARPTDFTFCNYQIQCSTVQLEIDSLNYKAFLNFPKGSRFEIDVLKNPESIEK